MRDEILNALCATPRVIERILRVFPHDHLDDHTGRALFSPRETIASLADNEMIILERIRLANSKPGTVLESIDPVARAKEHHYAEKNVFHEAEVFESRRLTTVEYLRDLSDADWAKTFTLSGHTVSISDYVTVILSHDMFHLDQISQHVATEAATIA